MAVKAIIDHGQEGQHKDSEASVQPCNHTTNQEMGIMMDEKEIMLHKPLQTQHSKNKKQDRNRNNNSPQQIQIQAPFITTTHPHSHPYSRSHSQYNDIRRDSIDNI